MEKFSVLVIDDSKSLRQYVEDLLSEAGYQVSLAPDGEIGLALIKKIEPDVVLLDIEMPIMNGREVLAALSPEGRLFSVVVLTSLSTMEDCLLGFGIGADDYIAKPFNDDELLARVRAASRTAQLKKDLAVSRDRALDLLHKYESSEKKLAEERELTAISRMISGIADKMNSPLGYIRSNIGTMLRYSDTLMELCERITALQANNTWTAEDVRQALNDEIKWMGQSKIDNIRKYIGPLAKETVQGIDRIADIVKKLLQIDIASRPSEKRPENMWHLLDVLVEQIRKLNPGITISIEAVKRPLFVKCNNVMISAALENIIENAIESINGEGWILIKLHNDKDSIKIEISDTGVGIPRNSLDTIFDPFFSAHPRTGKIGLGLTVAKYLINAHKGSIVINSDEGQGTRVRVELPLVKTEATLHKGTFISS